MRRSASVSRATPTMIIVVFTAIMVGVALLTLAERRICAWMQDRLGPNRVGPQGLLQPAADGLKNLVKEETLPARAEDRKSTRLNSSHSQISYAVFCLKKKKKHK